MYKRIKTFNDVGSPFFDKKYWYLRSRYIVNTEITQYDTDDIVHAKCVVNFADYINTEDCIYFSDFSNYQLGVINKSTFDLEYAEICLIGLNSESVTSRLQFVGNIKSKGFGLYDFKTMQIEKIFSPDPVYKRIISVNDSFFKIGGIETPGIISFCDLNDQLKWQLDLSESGSYKDVFGKKQIGEIKSVHSDQNSVIVVAGTVIVCYNLTTGNAMWELKSERWPFGKWLIVDGNVGYVAGEIGYQCIDLVNGTFISPVFTLKNIEIANKSISPSGREMVLNDGLLWHSISDSGISVIAAIDPSSGEYVWHQKIETKGWIHSPKFYLDKMYILSSEGELLIYQKE